MIASRIFFACGLLLAAALTLSSASAQELRHAAPDLHILAYHDVRATVTRNYDADQFAVSAEHVAHHFAWLRSNGYTVVGLDEVIAARQSERALPPRAVLITFDDGLRSVYTQVFPLLRLFNYRAVASVVTNWIGTTTPVVYDDRTLTADDFLTWDQVREMQTSGLVEIASHSHAMHGGVPGNPQGNLQPAAVTRIVADGRYESEAEWRARVRADLERSSTEIRKRTGRAPRAITWPYGAWNEPAREVAAELGMQVTLALDDTRPHEGLVLGRELIVANPGVGDFAGLFMPPPMRPLMRALHVDLTDIHDPDPARQEELLGRALDRVKASGASHVLLHAAADADNDGRADALFFPNRELPMRADLFNRAAWQLATRSHVKVFAVLPLSAYALDSTGDAVTMAGRIASIYADLAVHAKFDGLLFTHSAAALPVPAGLDHELAAAARRYRPDIVTAGELLADARADDADALAARLRTELQDHEFTIVSVQPAPFTAASATRFCSRLMPAVAIQPQGTQRTLIGLPPIDAAGDERAIDRALATLGACGVRNFAWQADVIPATEAEFGRLRHLMSAADMPWRE